jgi:RNA polymerase sigma factor (sigma-70 family)
MYHHDDMMETILEYWPQISFRIRGIIGFSNPDWEDVRIDVLIALIEALKKGKFRNECSLGTYIYSITSNKIVDYIRTKSRVPKFYLEPAEYPDPFEYVEKKERQSLVSKAMDKLKPRFAYLLYLYYYLEFTQNEIAGVFGLSTKRIHELLKDARSEMKRVLEA